jgi:hypothetical protein
MTKTIDLEKKTKQKIRLLSNTYAMIGDDHMNDSDSSNDVFVNRNFELKISIQLNDDLNDEIYDFDLATLNDRASCSISCLTFSYAFCVSYDDLSSTKKSKMTTSRVSSSLMSKPHRLPEEAADLQ